MKISGTTGRRLLTPVTGTRKICTCCCPRYVDVQFSGIQFFTEVLGQCVECPEQIFPSYIAGHRMTGETDDVNIIVNGLALISADGGCYNSVDDETKTTSRTSYALSDTGCTTPQYVEATVFSNLRTSVYVIPVADLLGVSLVFVTPVSSGGYGSVGGVCLTRRVVFWGNIVIDPSLRGTFIIANTQVLSACDSGSGCGTIPGSQLYTGGTAVVTLYD